jgi:hypothetical protein
VVIKSPQKPLYPKKNPLVFFYIFQASQHDSFHQLQGYQVRLFYHRFRFQKKTNDTLSAIADWFENRPINKANRSALASSIRARLDFVGVEWSRSSTDGVRMLDYACGPGFLSRVSIFHTATTPSPSLTIDVRYSHHTFRASRPSMRRRS